MSFKQSRVRVAGNPGPVQIRYELEKSRTETTEQRYHLRGERAATAAAFLGLAKNTDRARYQQDGASATIDLSFRDDDEYVDTVEIDFNAVQREWWTCPAYATLSEADRFKILSGLRALETFSSEGHSAAQIAAELADIGDDFPPPYADVLNDVFMNGETYIALLPVITFTRVHNYVTAAPFTITDIGKVFYTATMNANVPGNPSFALADAGVLNTIAANSLQTLGWLKSGRVSIASDGNRHYVQTYAFDAYAKARYIFV